MSPKIYEYRGISLLFFSKEHLPAHVHAYYADRYGMKVEFWMKGEKIARIEYSGLRGYRNFAPAQMHDLKKLIGKYQYEIVNGFFNFAIKNIRIKKTVIRRKIK